jgi:hypothetical protein
MAAGATTPATTSASTVAEAGSPVPAAGRRIRAGDLRSGGEGGIRNHGGGGGHPHLRCPLPAGSCERGIPGGDLRRRGPRPRFAAAGS